MSEPWSLIIPAVLTVVGWFVAAHWTVKQVNLAYLKNRELQTSMLRQSKKDALAKDFLQIYLKIAQTIGDLTQAPKIVK